MHSGFIFGVTTTRAGKVVVTPAEDGGKRGPDLLLKKWHAANVERQVHTHGRIFDQADDAIHQAIIVDKHSTASHAKDRFCTEIVIGSFLSLSMMPACRFRPSWTPALTLVAKSRDSILAKRF
jgi:hypothetical protein